MAPPRTANENAPTPSRNTTILPSIRHLLPDAGPSQPTYNLSRAHAHPSPSTSTQPLMNMQQLPSYPEPSNDSEEGDGDRSSDSPPKKRRRRQALSCTECKRRKIKCDRNHPCTPCTRRGEQDKCQWHVLEPVEKYVTRTEYDSLLARFESLESTVNQWMTRCTTNTNRDAPREHSHAPNSFRARAQSISGSIASSSGEPRRAYKLESPIAYTAALQSPRTVLRSAHMSSPYDEQREPPVFHRVSHERSPSGGSHKGILKILQADAELANGRHSPDERRSRSRSPSPIVDGRSPSPLSVTSRSSSGERERFAAYRPLRHEPYPIHYVRSTFCRDEQCDLDCGPYCVPTARIISSSYHA